MMSAIVNLTYRSPEEDITSCYGYNSDGTLNTRYTLVTMKNMLLHNANIISTLLNQIDSITEVDLTNHGIQVILNSPEVFTKLLDNRILIPFDHYNGSDSDFTNSEQEEVLPSDDEVVETNQDRLKMISNLVRQDDLQTIFESQDAHDSENDSNNIIEDYHNTHRLLEKYERILEKYCQEDHTSDSDTA